MSPLLLALVPIAAGAVKDDSTRRDLLVAGGVIAALYVLAGVASTRAGVAAARAAAGAIPSPSEAAAGVLMFPYNVGRRVGESIIRSGPHYR